MDCNKDESLRAKSIAEEKLEKKDFAVFEQKVSLPTGGPSPSAPPPSTESGIFNFSSKATSKTPKSQNKSKKTAPPAPKPAPSSNPSPCDTFWTICNHCKVQYEHLKKYLNCTLLCNDCKTPYMALATPPPQKFPKSSSQVPKQRQQSSSNHVRSQTQRRNMSSAEKPVAGQAGPLRGKSDPSVGAATVHMDHGAQDKVKRAFTESSSKDESVKKRKLEDYISGFGLHYNAGAGNVNSSASGSGSRSYGFPGFSGTYSQPNITRKLTALETRKMLIENTRKQILMKLSAWGSTTDEARGNAGGTNKNEHPEQSHPQQIRNQIEVMRGKGLKMLLVLSCVQTSSMTLNCLCLPVMDFEANETMLTSPDIHLNCPFINWLSWANILKNSNCTLRRSQTK